MIERSIIFDLDSPKWAVRGPVRHLYPGVSCPWPQRVKKRIAYIDYDYTDDLDLVSHDWLVRFTQEYYGGGFDSHGIIHTDTKDCYDRNNRINRDTFATCSATQMLIYYGNLQELENRWYRVY